MKRAAAISECRKYRWSLVRIWDHSLPRVLFIMLNPSIADGTEDDPTIRRCIDFAMQWGYGSMAVGNLFGYRATDPSELLTAKDPVGIDNQRYVLNLLGNCDEVILAWGDRAKRLNEKRVILGVLKRWQKATGKHAMCLGVTKDGNPKHPLYLPKKSVRIPCPIL